MGFRQMNSSFSECYKNLWYSNFASKEDANDLKSFFQARNVATDNIYTIYMDRRCATLHRLYNCAFAEEESVHTVSNSIVCSDSSLPQFVEDLRSIQWDSENYRNKYILIVDDILIHGRAIKNVWYYLRNVCGVPKDRINIDVFAYSTDTTKCLTDEIKARLLPTKSLNKTKWRTLSRELIHLITDSGFPHAAFVLYYSQTLECNKSDIRDWFNQAVSFSGIEVDNSRTTRIVWISQESILPNTIGSLIAKACVRGIYSPKTGLVSLIPFVITKSICKEQLHRVFKKIAEIIPETCQELKRQCNLYNQTDPKQTRISEYKLRLLNCILSIWYGEEFKKRYIKSEIAEKLTLDVSIVSYSFSEKIAYDLIEFQKHVGCLEDIVENSSEKSQEWYVSYNKYLPSKEDEDFKELLEKTLSQSEDTKWIWPKYFAEIGEQDDQRANQSQGRLRGISTEYVLQKLQVNDYLFAYLIDSWDKGNSALKYAFSDGPNNLYGTYSSAGELSFQYYFDRYSEHLNSLRNVANRVWYEQDLQRISIEAIRKLQIEKMEIYITNLDVTSLVKEDLRKFIRLYGVDLVSWNLNII